jgi:hypothetical protein
MMEVGEGVQGRESPFFVELAKYNLYMVAVQEVRWVEDGSQLADNYILFYGNDRRQY